MAVRVATLTLAALVAFLMLVGSTDAVQCYDCLNCGDPFKSSGVGKCDNTYCSKTKGQLGGMTTVIRGCSSFAPWDGCKTVKIAGASETTCYCTGHLCNSAPGLQHHSGVYALLATSAAVVLLAKLQG